MNTSTPLAVQRSRSHNAVFAFPNVPRGGEVRFDCDVDHAGEIAAIRFEDGHQGGPLTIREHDGAAVLLANVAARHDGDDMVAKAQAFIDGLRRRSESLDRFDQLAGRLVAKMRLSQTPVPGFMVGLSGTDSILVFLLLHEAATRMGMAHRLVGIHYVNEHRRKPTWFEEHIVPWLRERCHGSTVLVESPLGGNHDQQRWADLHLRALNTVERDEDGRTVTRALPHGHNYWVAGCVNATEHELGKFSQMSREVSLMPIRNVWKSNVMRMCKALEVPAIAMEYARLPDCLCGRDEIAASNIELIDAILKYDIRVRDHDPELLDQMLAYVRDLKRDNGFKQRTPYLV